MGTHPRPKHIPERMCVVCRRRQGKRALVRVARTADGVVIDETGKGPGRGAYVCRSAACWRAPGMEARLAAVLKTTLSGPDRARLAAYAAGLPEVTDGD